MSLLLLRKHGYFHKLYLMADWQLTTVHEVRDIVNISRCGF